jgi:hypothetical protein
MPVPSYRKFELGTYLEYGVADWITLVTSPSFDRIQTSPPPGSTQTTSGVGDTGIGARVRVYQSANFVFSVQGLLRPPLGLQIDPTDRFYTQSHVWTGELRSLIGYNTQIYGYDGFADLEMGYRWNDATATSNEWRADLTLGLHASDRLLILLQDFAAISDGRTQLTPSYYWDKGQVSGVYTFDAKWSGQLGAFMTLAGRNAGREIGPTAALWYRF